MGLVAPAVVVVTHIWTKPPFLLRAKLKARTQWNIDEGAPARSPGLHLHKFIWNIYNKIIGFLSKICLKYFKNLGTQLDLHQLNLLKVLSFTQRSKMALNGAHIFFNKRTPIQCVVITITSSRALQFWIRPVCRKFAIGQMKVFLWPDLGHSFFHKTNHVTNALQWSKNWEDSIVHEWTFGQKLVEETGRSE